MPDNGSNTLAGLALNGAHTILLTYTNTHVADAMIIVHLSVVSSGERLKDKLATSWQQYTEASVLLY